MTTRPGRERRFSGGTVAAAAAVATACVTLLFTLRPELAPDPRTRVGATIKSVAIDTDVSRADYYAALEPDDERRRRELEDAFLKGFLNTPDPTRPEIRRARAEGVLEQQRGSIVYIETQGQGLKNKSVTVYWFVYGARKRRREYGGGADIATLTAPDDQFIIPTFVDAPSQCERPIYVRLELRDENRSLLAIGTTKTFRSCRRG